jgi:SNF2 family DNA or RNA helicase
LDPRPAFYRPPDLPSPGPLVLDEEGHIVVPSYINTHLREYQRDGVRFFYNQFKQGRGALLGDDMGLVLPLCRLVNALNLLYPQGKTIQVISYLSAIMKKYGDSRDIDRRRHRVSDLQDTLQWRQNRSVPPANVNWATCLIVAPSSVMWQWQREFDTVSEHTIPQSFQEISMPLVLQWGYFELGMYHGAARREVLNDFKLGRLDVGAFS